MHNKVNDYYLGRLDDLPFLKRFHYTSRLYLWSQQADDKVTCLLDNMKMSYCGSNENEFHKILERLIRSPSSHFGSKHAAKERALRFSQFPILKPANSALFRVLFAKSIYGTDARNSIDTHLSKTKLQNLRNKLLSDPESIAMLSTHAINFVYLYHEFFLDESVPLSALDLWERSHTHYNLNDSTHLLLAIYLLTHCIIGKTLFYQRRIPASELDQYKQVTALLDGLLDGNLDSVTLDNKFEILVCHKLCGTTSRHEKSILAEAEKSFSKEGAFLVDTYNNGPKADNTSFSDSEHRNVLFVMSGTPTKLAPI